MIPKPCGCAHDSGKGGSYRFVGACRDLSEGRALVKDAFDLNFAGGTGPDHPVRTFMAALCGGMWMCAQPPLGCHLSARRLPVTAPVVLEG